MTFSAYKFVIAAVQRDCGGRVQEKKPLLTPYPTAIIARYC